MMDRTYGGGAHRLWLGARDRIVRRPAADAAADGGGTAGDYTIRRPIETAAAVRKKQDLTVKFLGFLLGFLDLAIGFIRSSCAWWLQAAQKAGMVKPQVWMRCRLSGSLPRRFPNSKHGTVSASRSQRLARPDLFGIM